MLVCGTHLLVELKLHIVEEGKLLVCLGARIGELSTLGFRPFTMAGPRVEVSSAVCVAQIAVLCVWHEPALVVAEELLEGSRTHGALALLLKHKVHILLLGTYHTLVVDSR